MLKDGRGTRGNAGAASAWMFPKAPVPFLPEPPKVCKIMAFMVIIRGLGLLFYILLGFWRASPKPLNPETVPSVFTSPFCRQGSGCQYEGRFSNMFCLQVCNPIPKDPLHLRNGIFSQQSHVVYWSVWFRVLGLGFAAMGGGDS